MTNVVSSSLPLWYSSKAKLFWREAEKYFNQFRYPESACSFGESVEYGTKAICQFLGIKPARKHDISKNLIALSEKPRFSKFKKQLSRAAWISSRWVGMAQRARELIRYGNPNAQMPATQIIGKKDVQPLKADVMELCQLLLQIEFSKKLKPPINLGILNGFVDNSDKNEIPCNEFPFNEFKNINIWRERFSKIKQNGTPKFNVKEIAISEINNELAVVINPFGEAYPEKEVETRLAFNILKDYVADGGILVNTAGFPFFYAWPVNKGEHAVPVVDEKIFTRELIVEKGQVIQERRRMGLGFAGSLLWKEFGGITTIETEKTPKITEFEVKQTDYDKIKAGDLINAGGSNRVSEFRAIRRETKRVIPLLRVERPDFGEVYPIAAIRHQWGCLIVAGMHMRTDVELEKLVCAVDNFCSWASQNMP